MLHRVCLETEIDSTLLFSLPGSPREPVKTHTLTKVLARQTTSTLGFPLTVNIYWQVSIAITEKQVQDISRPFNQYDDRSKDADINVVFLWQSGHRPLQRGTTYGIDGAFPDSLQPALLRIYEWASDKWRNHAIITLCQRLAIRSYAYLSASDCHSTPLVLHTFSIPP
jgi:hypothetical protein